MKKSLFIEENANELIERINKLTVSTTSLWGKMNVSQMLAHCNVAYDGALGKKITEDQSNIIFRTLVKWVALSKSPFRKNLPTGKEFMIADKRDFESEKKKLIQNIIDAKNHDKLGLWKPHPAFGKLSAEEWGWLLFKHTDHHLRQFGV